MVSILLVLVASSSSFALPGSLQKFWTTALTMERVATVTAHDFQVGRQWRWNYYDGKGAVYSSEQYTVIQNLNGEILIEMSTHFPGQTLFKPHHRILVRVEDCLRAYRDPFEKWAWSMRMFYLDKGTWNETTPPSTLAFEEKFNCNPYKHDSREFLTEFRTSQAGELFAQRRWRRLESSWFMRYGPNAGVSFEKEFPRGAGGETYRCRFDSGN